VVLEGVPSIVTVEERSHEVSANVSNVIKFDERKCLLRVGG